MHKSPKISFCIPTYNRIDKVFSLVKSILKYNGNDIEVLILDNCSSDGTKKVLDGIEDSRLRICQNKTNIGGIMNPIEVLSLAIGEFCFLCLDKDYISVGYIDELIEILSNDSGISFGYCELNLENKVQSVVFDKGFQSILNMSYLSSHPTGMFYKTNLFVKATSIRDSLKKNQIFGFPFDLINAEMALLGKSIQINLPVFSTESKDDCAEITSFTYKHIDDLFFTPKQQFRTFLIYCTHLLSLDITSLEKNIIVESIFKKSLLKSTLGYRDVMKDEFLCKHYLIESRRISFFEMVNYYFLFHFQFLGSNLKLSFIERIKLIIKVNFKFLNSILINKIRINRA